MLYAVVTTIQSPTTAVKELSDSLKRHTGRLIVVGDAKGPEVYSLENTDFLSLESQLQLPYKLPSRLPRGHYARKNVGYFQAIRQGAACIYETDDDNRPMSSWMPRSEFVDGLRVISAGLSDVRTRWVNVYKYFTPDLIWPRGFPLDEIHSPVPDAESLKKEACHSLRAPIQQGLVNGSPDVDAVWRLTMDRPFEFEDHPGIYLKPGNWCPFNTQSTWWWPVVYPLLYIPSHCSFRMCDIWKSFVAQRCLWELGLGVVYHAPEVLQARNPHDLMRDFRDEIPGYQGNRKLIQVLGDLSLQGGEGEVAGNLRRCYEALVCAGFFPTDELALVEAWLADLKALVVKV